eukprot:CAMPEP_0115463240 /NCGR_PEP_ID=MMETSP0271-20121206/48244_1 /TAXON_ID=71861 /ORGANISM="Scrippsiella trochoidea, Strain CCMP3099" /LENGTH=83 /DNA_ID=CAMNT_0002890065 /DNA_START=1107 /DNA_END=1355 /DNA_ORIENTATION=+
MGVQVNDPRVRQRHTPQRLDQEGVQCLIDLNFVCTNLVNANPITKLVAAMAASTAANAAELVAFMTLTSLLQDSAERCSASPA